MASSRSLWTEKLSQLSKGTTPRSLAASPPKAASGGRLRTRAAAPAAFAMATLPLFTGVVLGIDPSVRGTGLVVVSFQNGRPTLLHSRKVVVAPKVDFIGCLAEIHRAVSEVVTTYPVTAASIEETIYVQSMRTAQLMGVARGAALGPVAAKGIPVHQYAPTSIKKAATGDGAADKERVSMFVRGSLGVRSVQSLDETDAMAAVVCHVVTVGRIAA